VSELEALSQLILPEHQTTPSDVENSHWLFLAREPDTLAKTPEPRGYPFTFVIASLLVSDEFKAKLGLVNGTLAVSETMSAKLDADLLAWIDAITHTSASRDGAPVDRLTIVRRFLHDDRTREAVAAVGFHHIAEIDSINAALAQMDDVVKTINASELFDAAYYRRQLFDGMRVANPAAHYVLHGERMGLKPSAAFDPGVYADLNPDLATSALNRLFHYQTWGRHENRSYRHWPADHAMPPISEDTARPTILLVLHEATYTGAPILGWNLARALSDRCNVVVVLRAGGALEHALREVASVVIAAPPIEATQNPDQMNRFAERLIAVYRPLYVIANSIESRTIAMALSQHGAPVVALIHEFWPGAKPGIRFDFFAGCAALVFPARVVEESSFHAFHEIGLQNSFILPQGRCTIPPFHATSPPLPVGPPFGIEDDTLPSLQTLLTDGRRGAGPFTVIGLGAVEMRKGVDLFIAAATALQTKHPELTFRFVWIGTWEHAIGSPYAGLLDEQCRRSGLAGQLRFFPAVDDLEPVYGRADALFLSSRLDPLPNIVIDAAFHGVPVVCFDRASGAAELLKTNPDTGSLVVPYLDSGAAADRIAALAQNAELRTACSVALQALAQRSFDMVAYARRLDEIGHDAARKFETAAGDQRLIDEAEAFDASIYFGADHDVSATTMSSATYLEQTRHLNFASPPVPGVILRRPKPGFHPFTYGTQAPDFPSDGSRDPLAHYVEHGMPEGRWSHQVLRLDLLEAPDAQAPDTPVEQPDAKEAVLASVALHGHFHYPDNISDFMTALTANRLRADLFLTTTSVETAEILRSATKDYRGGSVVVEVGPNVGRDIYAFFRVLRTHIEGRYDLVGHIHGKRSLHTLEFDPHFGDRWRSFLWEHLLGSQYRAADIIVDAMRRDTTLGLIFPENGYLIGWEKNDDSAAALARRVGLNTDLPAHIEFPAGTMFWARVEALAMLARVDLREDEMPPEPIAIDGTVLHALERMLPLLCEDVGYTYATTYIPHLAR
jgi:glycosyltransferase involved in cell wall biosynthesis